MDWKLIAEDVTNRGKTDLTIKIRANIYIPEFKVGSQDALNQIKEKMIIKNIYLIGINFSEEEKNVTTFKWEKI